MQIDTVEVAVSSPVVPTISFQRIGAVAHLSSPDFYPLFNPYYVYCTPAPSTCARRSGRRCQGGFGTYHAGWNLRPIHRWPYALLPLCGRRPEVENINTICQSAFCPSDGQTGRNRITSCLPTNRPELRHRLSN